jgi:bisphosphoglycerate-independent phosphoglycerate mutase (AlkP superfamily)
VYLAGPPPEVLRVPTDSAAHTRLRIDSADAIDAQALRSHPMLKRVLLRAREMGGRLHLFSLLSTAGVHASIDHLGAVLGLAKEQGLRVVVHVMLDGIDTPARSYAPLVQALEAQLAGGVGRIGTVCGRMFGMDGDGRLDRTQKLYKAVVADDARRVDSALAGMEEACMFGASEGFAEPFVVFDYPGVSPVDTALHLGFTPPHARQLSAALGAQRFAGFVRKGSVAPFAGRFTCMTPYDPALDLPTLFARAPDPESLPLDVIRAQSCKLQACVKGTTAALAESAVAALQAPASELVLVDFGLPDPAPGGLLDAVLGAALGRIIDAARAHQGAVMVVSGRHADNTVGLSLLGCQGQLPALRDGGSVVDLGPTLLALLGLNTADDLEGESLLVV